MAHRTYILGYTEFEHYAQLLRFLRSERFRSLISRSQADSIADLVDPHLMCELALEQRTPKGTIYVHVDDELIGTIDQRGRINRNPGRKSISQQFAQLSRKV